MTTDKGVWNLQQVRDKQLQDLWTYSGGGELWVWGNNEEGGLGLNSITFYSSPVQLPGNWQDVSLNQAAGGDFNAAKKDDKWWVFGLNDYGQLGLNNRTNYSSPVQLPGTTWSQVMACTTHSLALKTDGTLWSWGKNERGQLGQNGGNNAHLSSPTQIPGTTWSKLFVGGNLDAAALKTDGTLWTWGGNFQGQLGDGTSVYRSSPVQCPGTTWSWVATNSAYMVASKTDNTLWAWGTGYHGEHAQNNRTYYSSPRQIPGTNWATGEYSVAVAAPGQAMAIKTDGTLWGWGRNLDGGLARDPNYMYSSPVQIPGTTWSKVYGIAAKKTDGTLWAWGTNTHGQLGQNNLTQYSSPVQIPGTDWYKPGGSGGNDFNRGSRLFLKDA